MFLGGLSGQLAKEHPFHCDYNESCPLLCSLSISLASHYLSLLVKYCMLLTLRSLKMELPQLLTTSIPQVHGDSLAGLDFLIVNAKIVQGSM